MKDDSPLILQKFGKYLLLDHLVDGGMAKICRARYLDGELDKVIAIKMIKEKFSANPVFKTMFMDEIKLTFGLVHPNIAQTFDYGELDGNLFTAMEYVQGRNLREYTEQLLLQKYIIPIEISVYIMMQVCQALYYTHNKKNQLTGESLNIIHRDISPHNIMITYDGIVKLIDFGIAKAKSNSTSTKVGTIKGKLTYIGPEYLDGVALDHRYDQFAVGITLWELLVGKKLFSGENDLAVLKNVQKCQIPLPSSLNPRIPQELDNIVLKSLSKNRDDRYSDMDQMNRALNKFLYEYFPQFNPSDVGIFAQKLFKSSIEKERDRFYQFGKLDISLYQQDDEIIQGSNYDISTSESTLTRRKDGSLNKKLVDIKRPKSKSKWEETVKKNITSNISSYAAAICVCLLAVFWLFSGGDEDRKIASNSNLIITNYDAKIHQVSINGVEITPGPNGEIYSSFNNKSELRVNIIGRADYVTLLDFREDSFPVKLTIPNTPVVVNAYLYASKDCGNGKIIFKSGDEGFGGDTERIESLPLRPNQRIAFPLRSDENGTYYVTQFQIGYQRANSSLSVNLKFVASKKDERIDLCKLLENAPSI